MYNLIFDLWSRITTQRNRVDQKYLLIKITTVQIYKLFSSIQHTLVINRDIIGKFKCDFFFD